MQAHEFEQALSGIDEATKTKQPDLPHAAVSVLDVHSISIGKTPEDDELYMVFNGVRAGGDASPSMPVGTRTAEKFFGLDSKQYQGKYAQERMVNLRLFLAAMTKLDPASTPGQIAAAVNGAKTSTGKPVNSWLTLASYLSTLPDGSLAGRCYVKVVKGPTRHGKRPRKDGSYSTFCDSQYYPASGPNG
jgi:hypothetical protein